MHIRSILQVGKLRLGAVREPQPRSRASKMHNWVVDLAPRVSGPVSSSCWPPAALVYPDTAPRVRVRLGAGRGIGGQLADLNTGSLTKACHGCSGISWAPWCLEVKTPCWLLQLAWLSPSETFLAPLLVQVSLGIYGGLVPGPPRITNSSPCIEWCTICIWPTRSDRFRGEGGLYNVQFNW
jgi:hypothetical protein